MAPRTPSTFAVLGLLTVKSWSAYELVSHMKRSTIRFIWPRAESKLYEEPKRLTVRGWARSRATDSGPASYTITPTGRTALRAWLAEPAGSVTVESEALLKVLFADSGTKEELLATIRSVRNNMIDGREELIRPNATRYATEGPEFPERAHVTALVAQFVVHVQDAIIEWAEWASERVSQWDDTRPSQERTGEAVDLAREWLEQHPLPADSSANPARVRRG